MQNFNKHHRGIYTEIRPCLRPDPNTEYRTLINELKETTYKSSWRKILGHSRDQTPGLPVNLNPYEFTFGKPTTWDEVGVSQLLQPLKWSDRVLTDDGGLYKKTHNDYEPGERICRNYLKSFDPDRRYGKRVEFNPLGVLTKCALKWCQDPISISNVVQADYKKRGENFDPTSKREAAGKPILRQFYNVEDLLKDYNCDPSILKRNIGDWMKRFHKFRQFIKNNPPDLREYEVNFSYCDSNLLPLDEFYKISNNFGLNRFLKELEPLLEFLKIITNKYIDFKRFLQLINSGLELPKIDDISNDHQYYETTTQQQFKYPDNYQKVRSFNELKTVDEAGSLINPNIFTKYGLSSGDFYVPRTKIIIRQLFEKIGYQFDDKIFDSVWEKGVNQDQTGRVCIDTFYTLIKSHGDNL